MTAICVPRASRSFRSLRRAKRSRAASSRAGGARWYWTSPRDARRVCRVDPAAENGHPLGGPCSVTRHRAGVDTMQDRVGVRRDVLEGPEIEAGTHRVAVALAEQWLDVLLEAD